MITGNSKNKIIAVITSIIMVMTAFPFLAIEADGASDLSSLYASTVQSYTDKSDKFKLSSETRFYIVSNDKPAKSLEKTVTLAAREFAAYKIPTAKTLSVVSGKETSAKDGDILIKKIPGKYSDETYVMTIGKKTVINASTDSGVYRGLVSLLKYRKLAASATLKGCLVKDYPDVKERTVHLDCGRKYFSPNWIKNFIKRSSWQGYNAIEMHFSEDQGLRLKSQKYPWLAGTYNKSKGILTKKQMESIINTAKTYHMEVIPSFDSPGHLNYITKRYASYVSKHKNFSFKYKGKTYSKKRKGFSNISNYYSYGGKKTGFSYQGINLSNQTARAFISSLIDEYAEFFAEHGCRKFNIGGDELLGWNTVKLAGKTFSGVNKWKALKHWDLYAQKILKIRGGNATDTFAAYMNSTAKRLEKMGYKCRMWNDEIYRFKGQHVKLKKSIAVVYWSNNYKPVKSLEKKGFNIHNALSLWTYYVIGVNYKNVKPERIYKYWRPDNFASPGEASIKIRSKQYKGAYFCIWCDHASQKSQSEVWKDTQNLMWTNSIKMMNAGLNTKRSGNKKALSYNNFKKYVVRINTFPGYSGKPGKASELPESPKLTENSNIGSILASLF